MKDSVTQTIARSASKLFKTLAVAAIVQGCLLYNHIKKYEVAIVKKEELDENPSWEDLDLQFRLPAVSRYAFKRYFNVQVLTFFHRRDQYLYTFEFPNWIAVP